MDRPQSPPVEGEILVRMRRPDGRQFLLRVAEEHLQRVMDLANGEFGDKSIDLGGPDLPKGMKCESEQ